MPGNEKVFELYWRMGDGCFRFTGMGDVIGLDWPSIKIIAEALEIPLDGYMIDALKVIENTSLEFMRTKEKPA